jgi:ribosomal subunit interface protein
MHKNKVIISFHQVDQSDAVEDKIRQKLDKVFNKYGNNLTRLEWTCSVVNSKESRGRELFQSKAHVHLAGKPDFVVHYDAENLYSTLEPVIRKLNKYLEKVS